MSHGKKHIKMYAPATPSIHSRRMHLYLPQNPHHKIVSVIYKRRTSRKVMQHAINIDEKGYHTGHRQTPPYSFFVSSYYIALPKEIHQKENPKRRGRIQIHPPSKAARQNIPNGSGHPAPRTGEPECNQKRTECVKYCPDDHTVNRKENYPYVIILNIRRYSS